METTSCSTFELQPYTYYVYIFFFSDIIRENRGCIYDSKLRIKNWKNTISCICWRSAFVCTSCKHFSSNFGSQGYAQCTSSAQVNAVPLEKRGLLYTIQVYPIFSYIWSFCRHLEGQVQSAQRNKKTCLKLNAYTRQQSITIFSDNRCRCIGII